jgi:membrane protein DedA with SNARE-associated domain
MIEWLTHRPLFLVYGFLFLNAALESPAPPYPTDIFVLLFAFLGGQGKYNPSLIYLLTVTGSIAGFMVLYYLAKYRGERLVAGLAKTFLRPVLPQSLIARVKRKFLTHGDLFLLFNRFLPGMRAPIGFTAGLTRTSAKKVFGYGLLSALAWNLVLILIGFRLGKSWSAASRFLHRYNLIALALIAVFLTAFSFFYFLHRKPE